MLRQVVVQPVDLFPHTNHYMTVLLLVRVAQVTSNTAEHTALRAEYRVRVLIKVSLSRRTCCTRTAPT